MYAISVNIPDVDCTNNCALYMINPKTDSLTGNTCTYDPVCDAAGTCQEPKCTITYNSIANVRITGNTRKSAFQCPPLPGKDTFPFAALTPNLYSKGEVGQYNGAWITTPGIHRNYVIAQGPCSNVVAPLGQNAIPSALPKALAPVDYTAVLTTAAMGAGGAAVPTQSASGQAVIWYDAAAGSISGTVFHTAPAGTKETVKIMGPASTNSTGPTLFTFTNTQSPVTIPPTPVTAAQATILSNGQAYVVVSASGYANGLLRGQILPVSTTGSVSGALTMAQANRETNLPSTPYTGSVTVTLDPATNQLVYSIFHTVGSAATEVTITGPAQPFTSGATLFTLATGSQARVSPVTGRTRPLTSQEESNYRLGLLAVVVASNSNPSGEVKAQLTAPTGVITADPVVGSKAPTPPATSPTAPGPNNNDDGNTEPSKKAEKDYSKTNKSAVIAAALGWLVAVGVIVGLVFVFVSRRGSGQGRQANKVPDEDGIF